VVVVTSPELREAVAALCAERLAGRPWRVALGGERRQDSVAAGLAAAPDAGIIVVHDGARPFAEAALFKAAVAAVRGGADAAIAALPLTDTLKRVDGETVVATLDRSVHTLAQTPQAFRRAALERALATAREEGRTVTDEATLVEQGGGRVVTVPGSRRNLKLTVPEDLDLALAIATTPARQVRTGIGYDVHRLVPERRLVLGGVEIPFERGLDGHSDADVALHAIMDALLGACALGDIGHHFPPGDPTYRNADSRALLRAVGELLAERGAVVMNVDCTIVAEAPKLLPHVPAMRAAIADCLGIAPEQVSLKATTNELMGFVGRGEGIAALATATVTVPG
jgi:2-C-methyl-D-erythritol 4-phosphate cytidylyltransferase/2-C-methyl-D-erythritol 2,4-cyclodiphosphate synthase